MLSLAMTLDTAPAETVEDRRRPRAGARRGARRRHAPSSSCTASTRGACTRWSGGWPAARPRAPRTWCRKPSSAPGRRLPAFRFESAFSTWLHRLAVNTALMEIRSRAGAEDRETDDCRAGVPAKPRHRRPAHARTARPRARGRDPARARPRRAGAARHRRLETRGDRRRTRHGGRKFQGSIASRARTVAPAPGRRP